MLTFIRITALLLISYSFTFGQQPTEEEILVQWGLLQKSQTSLADYQRAEYVTIDFYEGSFSSKEPQYIIMMPVIEGDHYKYVCFLLEGQPGSYVANLEWYEFTSEVYILDVNNDGINELHLIQKTLGEWNEDYATHLLVSIQENESVIHYQQDFFNLVNLPFYRVEKGMEIIKTVDLLWADQDGDGVLEIQESVRIYTILELGISTATSTPAMEQSLNIYKFKNGKYVLEPSE